MPKSQFKEVNLITDTVKIIHDSDTSHIHDWIGLEKAAAEFGRLKLSQKSLVNKNKNIKRISQSRLERLNVAEDKIWLLTQALKIKTLERGKE